MRLLPLLALLGCGPTGPTAPCERAFWLDSDGDGFGGRSEVWIGCEAPPAYVDGPADCADKDNKIHPDAPELCDEVDNDCDGEIDEDPRTPLLLFLDDDNDGYGSSEETRYGCPTEGWSTLSTDCDDFASWINPAADETCDGFDRNCDGHAVLGAVDGEPWYRDNDGDGFGRTTNSTLGCGDLDPGYVLNADDCDDNNGNIHPDAVEGLFDGVDANCDGLERCPYDADGDGWGGQSVITADLACSLVGAVTNTADCDDSDPAISPDAEEIWYSGVDEDCDPVTRDDDLDEDGALAADDCDDWDPQNNPFYPPPGAFTLANLGIDGLQWDPMTSPALCPSAVEERTGGAAVADYDGDGRLDVFLPRMYAPDALYHQLPDGNFEEVGALAGVDWAGSSSAALWVDVDADGDLDLALVMAGNEPNRLYIHDGVGGFVEEGALRGFGQPLNDPLLCSRLLSVSAADVDGDGDLDLHTGAWQPSDLPGTDRTRLYLNDGAGSFTDGSVAAGVGFPVRAATATAFVDPDGDGDLDLALAGDFSTSVLFRNEGAGQFVNITASVGLGGDENAAGSEWADFDNDGDLDWFLSGIYDPLTVPCDQGWGCSGNRLYRNDGAGFTDVTDAAGVRDGAWGQGAAFFDLDHDGDLDLVQQTGSGEPGFDNHPVRLFENDGSGGFTDESCRFRVEGFTGQGRGALPFDLDADGDLDLLLVQNAGPPALLRNEGAHAAGHWLRLALRDPGSANPFAVGASVLATPAAADPVYRVQHANSSSLVSGPPEVHLGLGSATTVDLAITWPDGAVQLETAVPTDQILELQRSVP